MSELRIDGVGSLPKVLKPRTAFLGVAYSFGYGLLFLLAGHIVGLYEFSLWFPAAGLRFAVLLIVGWRFGFVAAICEILVQGAVGEWANWDGYAFTMIGGIAGPPVIYALFVWFLETVPNIQIERARLSDIVWISAAALLAPALTAPISTGFLYIADRMPPEVFWDATASFWVGDAVGILMLVPILLTGRIFFQRNPGSSIPRRIQIDHGKVGELGLIVFLSVAWFWFTGFSGNPAFWYPAFLPLIWMSLRFGWTGVAISILVLNLLSAGIAANLTTPDDRLSLQMFLIVLSFAGIFIGAVVTELTRSLKQHASELMELTHTDRLNTFGHVAAGIIHQINQPLATLSMYTQESSKRLDADNLTKDDLVDIVGRLQNETNQLRRIVDGMYSLGSVGSSEHQYFDVNVLLRIVAELLKYEAAKASVRIHLDLADNLPDLFGHQGQIEQALMNLGRNGIQAMAELVPGKRSELLFRAHFSDGQIVIEITDNGNGIDGNAAAGIFEPFSSGKEGGLGVGLSMSRTIIRAHGGDLTYVSAPGEGTTFTIQLPERSEHVRG